VAEVALIAFLIRTHFPVEVRSIKESGRGQKDVRQKIALKLLALHFFVLHFFVRVGFLWQMTPVF
jgi:hypothetical protein